MFRVWFFFLKITIYLNSGDGAWIFSNAYKMSIFEKIFIEPVFNLYIHLPYIGWEGKYQSQICATLTGVHEQHWLFQGYAECSDIISRNFTSKVTILRSILQLYVILITCCDLLYITRKKILSFFFFNYSKNDAMCE